MSTLLLKSYLGLSALAPWLLRWMARKAHAAQGAEKPRRAERFGRATRPRPDGPLVWLHAASVGEVQSIASLAPLLMQEASLLITTTTQTGALRAASLLPEKALHQFQPIDTVASVKRFLNHWKPDIALFVEGDVWPRMSKTLAERGTPAVLLNARASRSRKRFKHSSKALLAPFAAITCQSEDVRGDLAALGLRQERLFCLGDLKADLPAPAADPAALADFKAACAQRPCWAAVSTHPDDEAHVLAAHHQLLQSHPEALLLWLPRHPERAASLLQLITLPVAQRSANARPTAETAIYLVDTLGEAGAAFAAVSPVFLGGSFGDEGGHNPFEPVKAGAMVLHGPKVDNFQTAYQTITDQGDAKEVRTSKDLAEAVLSFLESGGGTARTARQRRYSSSANAAQATARLLNSLLQAAPH